MDLGGNFAGCLASGDVLELLIHDGRFSFMEDMCDGSPAVQHRSPLCRLISSRQECAAQKSILYAVSDAVEGVPCQSRCKEVDIYTTVDQVSLRFGQRAWNTFTDDDEELRVVMFYEDEDDVTHGVVHRAECIALEDGEDGECVLCLPAELDAIADEFSCCFDDCTCDA